MALRLAHISAMTYYEMRMLWRQRMLRVLVLSIIMIVGLAMMAMRALANVELPSEAMPDVLLTRLANNVITGYVFWPLAYVLLLIMGSLVVADVVPRDHQLGVSTVIDSTPLTSRRKAIMFCLAYGVICVLLLQGSGLSTASFWGLLNPARPYALYYYWLGWLSGLSLFSTSIGYAEAQWSLVIGILELSSVGLLAWLWLRVREGRMESIRFEE